MTRSARRLIFLIATIIFLAAGYFAILYAQGYRYDFVQAKFSRTGAVSLHVNTQADVYVNGVRKDNTSFITNSGSVSGLLPGTYTVSIQKDGYSKWQKKVTIQAGFVQDFSHVLILPTIGEDHDNVVKEIMGLLYTPTPTPLPSPKATVSPTRTPKPTPTPSPSITPTPDVSGPYYIENNTLYVNSEDGPVSIASNVSEVFRSGDGQKLMWATGSQIWLYWLADQNEQPFHKANDILVLAKLNQSIHTLAWFRDSSHVVANIGTAEAPVIKVIELDTRGGQNIISL